jgi:hypothetical protein
MTVRSIVGSMIGVLLILGMLGGPVQAAPANASADCKEVDDFGQTHGACVSATTAENSTATIANFCRDEVVRAELAEQLGLDSVNHGQCVKFYPQVFGV